MPDAQWIDGHADGMGHAIDAYGNRYSIPRKLDGGMEPGDRIQFVVQPHTWRNRRWVNKLLLRP